MKNFFCFPVCMLCAGSFCPKCHMALWRKWRKLCATCATYANVPSGTNFIYERRVPILIIYHNVH